MKFHDFHNFLSRGWTLTLPEISYTNVSGAELLHRPNYIYQLATDKSLARSNGWIQRYRQTTDANVEVVYSSYRCDLPRAVIVLLFKTKKWTVSTSHIIMKHCAAAQGIHQNLTQLEAGNVISRPDSVILRFHEIS